MNVQVRDVDRREKGAPSRSLLLSLLTEACELEHGLACCYLFAAFSLKKDLSEAGMTWERQRLTRMWAAQIFMVAAQEMQHLAEAWNLLLAFGGTAFYGRPPFPQPSKYYHLRHRDSPALELTAFSRQALDRFILFEEPDTVASERQSPLGFDTIGGLYRRVEDLITELDHRALFLGDPNSQVGPALADFPGLSAITDRDSAIAAVERIITQGEGTRTDHVDSHLGVFRTIRDQLDDATSSWDDDFNPARPVISNPVTPRHAAQAANANPVTNEETARLAELFDGAYTLMLALLGASFAHGASDRRGRLAHVGIGLMPTVLRPIAESLTQLPATSRTTPTAGPGFFISRFLPLPPDPDIARTLATERLAELAKACEDLPADTLHPTRRELAERLHGWANHLR
jgi:hypothetical protein